MLGPSSMLHWQGIAGYEGGRGSGTRYLTAPQPTASTVDVSRDNKTPLNILPATYIRQIATQREKDSPYSESHVRVVTVCGGAAFCLFFRRVIAQSQLKIELFTVRELYWQAASLAVPGPPCTLPAGYWVKYRLLLT